LGGKARLSKAGMGQWVHAGEKAGGRQGGVPGQADRAGRQVFGEAVQSLKDVLKAQRRWGSRVVWPVGGNPQQGGRGGSSCRRRKLLVVVGGEKVASGCGLNWAKGKLLQVAVRSEGGGTE